MDYVTHVSYVRHVVCLHVILSLHALYLARDVTDVRKDITVWQRRHSWGKAHHVYQVCYAYWTTPTCISSMSLCTSTASPEATSGTVSLIQDLVVLRDSEPALGCLEVPREHFTRKTQVEWLQLVPIIIWDLSALT